jgi:hypothetical protein
MDYEPAYVDGKSRKMIETLFKLGMNTHNLGGTGFMPVPSWLRVLLNTMTPARQMLVYARLMDGKDLSQIAPNDIGCAESVTRITNILFGDEVITGTYSLLEYLLRNNIVWKEVYTPSDGVVVMAATGTGNGSIQGRVGIYENGRIWSNNSITDKWDTHFSHQAFVYRYQVLGGMKVRYFVRVPLLD